MKSVSQEEHVTRLAASPPVSTAASRSAAPTPSPVPPPPAPREPALDEADLQGVRSRRRLVGAVPNVDPFEHAFEHAPIGMALVAPDGRWLRVNAALCELLGRAEDDLLAGSWQEITHPDDLERDLTELRCVLDGSSDGYRIEKRYVRPDGESVWVLLVVSLVRGDDGNPTLCISQVVDITELKRAEEQLLHAATHDALTGLCNRARFHEALAETQARVERYDEPVALLLLDLDGFKDVNDRLGHAAGDEMLRCAAAALTEATRASDLCARLGGDELAVLLASTERTAARTAGQRVVEAIRTRTDGKVTASVGLAQARLGTDASAWLRQADVAMYAAKSSGGDRLVVA